MITTLVEFVVRMRIGQQQYTRPVVGKWLPWEAEELDINVKELLVTVWVLTIIAVAPQSRVAGSGQ